MSATIVSSVSHSVVFPNSGFYSLRFLSLPPHSFFFILLSKVSRVPFRIFFLFHHLLTLQPP